MRLVIVILCLLLPLRADAAPAVAAVAAWVAANVVLAIQIALTVGMAIYGAAQQRKAERDARNAYNANLQDRTITNVTMEAPHTYVYGRAKVGATVVGIFSSGAKDEYKHLVCVHAAHECDGIEEIYISGKALGPLDASGQVTSGDYFSQRTNIAKQFIYGGSNSVVLDHAPIPGTISCTTNTFDVTFGLIPGQESAVSFSVSGQTVTLDQANPNNLDTVVNYRYIEDLPRVRAFKHLGSPSDAADASLLAEVPGMWPASAVLRGFCYTVIRLDLNQAEFQGGLPQIQVLLRGKKILDIRNGATAWSQNPALVTYDYLRSQICGVDAADIPDAQFITAANVCDEAQWFGPRYVFNGVVTSDQPQSGVLEKMAQSMAGGIVSTTWDIWAGKYVSPIMALDQSDIVGDVAITPGVSDGVLYNGVRGQFITSENNYVATDFKPFQNAAYLASDGRELWTNIDFPFTDTLQRVWNLCRIYTEDQRNGYTLKAGFSLKTWSLKVGQRVTFTSSFFGQTAKVFRVTDKSYSPTSVVELTLKEDDPSIWDFADAVVVEATPNTNLPNPYAISPLESISCESGENVLLLQRDGSVLSRILATWPQATTQAVFTSGVIELEWRRADSSTWSKTSVSGSDLGAYISPVVDGAYYMVRARTVNTYLNVKSDWTYAAAHRVIGKTAPPDNVPWFTIEGNTLTWGAVTNIDLAGYRIRFHYGLNRSWGDANPLHTGLIAGGPYTPDALPQGQITLMIKAVDTTGNESAAQSVIQTAFGDAMVENVVETVDFKVLGYPGTLTGCAIVGGVLKANTTSVFYGNDAANFYGDYESLPFYIDAYSAMVYETPIFTPTKAVEDSNMTLNASVTGGAQFIEYRVSGANAMFPTVATEPFYVDDAAPFYGPPGVYQPWPGQVSAKNLQYQFRFSIGQGATQGIIDTCNETIDVPDISEILNDIVISAAGTRLPLTKQYSFIKNIQLTLQSDGGTARTPLIIDKNAALGPLIKCQDASGAYVQGLIDAIPQGY